MVGWPVLRNDTKGGDAGWNCGAVVRTAMDLEHARARGKTSSRSMVRGVI